MVVSEERRRGDAARKPRVLIFADQFGYEELRDLAQDDFDVVCIRDGTAEQLREQIRACDAYMATVRLQVDREMIESAPRLKLVATYSTGTDHLDLPALAARGVAVLSLKDDREILDQVTSTAELAFGLLLTCARRLAECFDATRQGRWERHHLAGRQLSGLTLGIIGCGRLGTMMAQYGRAFRMRVLATDPHAKMFPEGVTPVDLGTLLREADFVSLHVHLTAETRNLLGACELAQMKPGACLINTSRGGLIDEAALIAEMKAGRIAAAGLDVIDGEWLPDKFNHPLIAYSRENPRLCITPHVGGTSPDAIRLTARHTFRKVLGFFRR
jgi:D-3-phosphoglycerate dehydrogenase